MSLLDVFAHPWLLLLLPPLAALAWWWSARSSGHVVFSSLRALPAGGHTWRTRLAWLPELCMALAVASLVIALAGPRHGDKDSRVRREGIAIMMAVDISGSMRAIDLSEPDRELTRLDAVKEVFGRFVLGGDGLSGRLDDVVGLVAFAMYAETRSPLTLDHPNLAAAARQLDFAPPDEDRTSIGAGLALAVQRLAEYKPETRVGRIVILLTDGESNHHEIPEDAAIQDAIEAGVKVYTIGAGTNGIAGIRVPREDGRSELMQTRVRIDEATLRRIADKTGGQYFRATDHASLEQIYKQIDRLERTEHAQDRFTEFHQYYGWFVVAAMVLVVAGLLLRATLLRRLP